MAQWESQTRKMNRHYQSAGQGQGVFWTPPFSVDSSTNIMDGETSIGFAGIIFDQLWYPDTQEYVWRVYPRLFATYYDNQGTFLWDDNMQYIYFYPERERVRSVRNTTRQFDIYGVQGTTNTQIITIDYANVQPADKYEYCFDASTGLYYTPFLDVITGIVIEISDPIPALYNDRVIWWKFNHGTSQYPYVNTTMNQEYFVTV